MLTSSSPLRLKGTLRLVYDPSTGKAILFDGYDCVTQFNDTWAYSSNP